MKVSLLERLAEQFLKDIQTGKRPNEAGWIETTGDELNSILELNLVERKNGHIRLSINEENLKTLLQRLRGDDYAIELADTCIDIARAIGVKGWMESAVKEHTESPHIPAALTALGWFRMLSTSSFSVVVDSILREGLNVVEWSAEAPKASWNLSMDVVKKSLGVNPETIYQVMKTLQIPLPDIHETEIVDKIRKVLVWSQVVVRFSKEEAEMLGFLWCIDYLSARKEIQYPEALTFIQEQAWELLWKGYGKRKTEFLERLDAIIEELVKLSSIDDAPTVAWRSIIRLPW